MYTVIIFLIFSLLTPVLNSTFFVVLILSLKFISLISTTLIKTSDSFTSSNVALKASISCVGILEIKPTVSIIVAFFEFKNILLILVSRVAKSSSLAYSFFFVNLLNNVDFPELV